MQVKNSRLTLLTKMSNTNNWNKENSQPPYEPYCIPPPNYPTSSCTPLSTNNSNLFYTRILKDIILTIIVQSDLDWFIQWVILFSTNSMLQPYNHRIILLFPMLRITSLLMIYLTTLRLILILIITLLMILILIAWKIMRSYLTPTNRVYFIPLNYNI